MIRRPSTAFLLALACCSSKERGGEPQQGPRGTAVPSVAAYRALPPEAYLQEEDRRRARNNRLGELPCSRTSIMDGESVENMVPTDKCVRMLPRQRFKGVWLNRFEGSAFVPNAATWPKEEPRIWLNVERVKLREQGYDRPAYLLEFEGRQTMYPWSYGPCCYEHEVIVDRIISATPLKDEGRS